MSAARRSGLEEGQLRATVAMDEDILLIERQIERCRRLAESMTDDEVRHSLERLAAEYESQLRALPGSFMLSPLRSPD